MKISTSAVATLKRLSNDYAAAGFGPHETWVFAPETGEEPSFKELWALQLIRPFGAGARMFRFTERGQKWAMEHRDDPVNGERPMKDPPDINGADSVLDDATRVLLHLSNAGQPPRQGHMALEGNALVGPLNLTPERINDAVDILEESGFVETGRYLGTHPFVFKDVSLTARGRLEAGRLKQPPRPTPSTAPSAADAPRVRRVLNPVGSPYGFQDEEWEQVQRDQGDPQKLIVVFGHQWNSSNFNSAELQRNVQESIQRALAEVTEVLPGRPPIQLDFRVLKAGYGSHLFNEIAKDILGADIAIFDTSDMNPNVFLELGVALTWGRRILPIRERSTQPPPSDISGQTWATYSDSGKIWDDDEHHAKMVAMVKRAVEKKLVTTSR
jgi:hypothetical protein